MVQVDRSGVEQMLQSNPYNNANGNRGAYPPFTFGQDNNTGGFDANARQFGVGLNANNASGFNNNAGNNFAGANSGFGGMNNGFAGAQNNAFNNMGFNNAANNAVFNNGGFNSGLAGGYNASLAAGRIIEAAPGSLLPPSVTRTETPTASGAPIITETKVNPPMANIPPLHDTIATPTVVPSITRATYAAPFTTLVPSVTRTTIATPIIAPTLIPSVTRTILPCFDTYIAPAVIPSITRSVYSAPLIPSVTRTTFVY